MEPAAGDVCETSEGDLSLWSLTYSMKKSIYFSFFKMSKLYHFTSFNSACKIIESGKLRFSKSFKLNDLIESDLDGYTLYESWGVPMWSEQCGEM